MSKGNNTKHHSSGHGNTYSEAIKQGRELARRIDESTLKRVDVLAQAVQSNTAILMNYVACQQILIDKGIVTDEDIANKLEVMQEAREQRAKDEIEKTRKEILNDNSNTEDTETSAIQPQDGSDNEDSFGDAGLTLLQDEGIGGTETDEHVD